MKNLSIPIIAFFILIAIFICGISLLQYSSKEGRDKENILIEKCQNMPKECECRVFETTKFNSLYIQYKDLTTGKFTNESVK